MGVAHPTMVIQCLGIWPSRWAARQSGVLTSVVGPTETMVSGHRGQSASNLRKSATETVLNASSSCSTRQIRRAGTSSGNRARPVGPSSARFAELDRASTPCSLATLA